MKEVGGRGSKVGICIWFRAVSPALCLVEAIFNEMTDDDVLLEINYDVCFSSRKDCVNCRAHRSRCWICDILYVIYVSITIWLGESCMWRNRTLMPVILNVLLLFCMIGWKWRMGNVDVIEWQRGLMSVEAFKHSIGNTRHFWYWDFSGSVRIRHLLGAITKVDHGRRAEAWEELVSIKEPRKSYCTCNTEPLQEWSPIDDSHDYSCPVHNPCRCDRDARQCFSIMNVAESAKSFSPLSRMVQSTPPIACLKCLHQEVLKLIH